MIALAWAGLGGLSVQALLIAIGFAGARMSRRRRKASEACADCGEPLLHDDVTSFEVGRTTEGLQRVGVRVSFGGGRVAVFTFTPDGAKDFAECIADSATRACGAGEVAP